MIETGWTYESFCQFISKFTSASSSPTNAETLNPLIRRLLTVFPGSSIFSPGGHSVLLSITEDIAAKVSLQSDGPHLRHEQTMLELVGKAKCPDIIEVFLCRPDIMFMHLLRNGTLHQRVITVPKKCPVLQWMQELADAVACLESLGYAHGDINPRNVLVDDDDHLKLIDFDHACKIGDDLDVGYEPYVRSQRLGEPGGNYGVAGPVTEQFALGSVFWFITRRTELYADLEGPDKVDRLIDRQSPVTDPQDPVDVIIRSCWFGELPSIADLSKRIRDVSGVHSQEIMVTPDVYEKRKEECKQYYDKLACDN